MDQAKKVCRRCVMDTTDPEIRFDKRGYCSHCNHIEEIMKLEPYCLDCEEKLRRLSALVEDIKKRGEHTAYNCVIGLSGGVDSSFVAYKVVKELGLRPLAVHLDNGWDSELAVRNIENICRKLEIDLYTHVINWEEFRDLQLSFLKASTPDSEIPSDHAITALLYAAAKKEHLRYILAGTNLVSESILPRSWSQGHPDWTYIKAVHKKYGHHPLKTFPHRSYFQHIFNKIMNRIHWVDILDYFDYHRENAKVLITRELNWKDYGRKHGESVYTRFFQEFILPIKFGFDKRKAHYSSLIMAGQLIRDQAVDLLKQPLYPSPAEAEKDIAYIITKFGITRHEFDDIMMLPPRSYWDYPNFQRKWLFKLARKFYYLIKGQRL